MDDNKLKVLQDIGYRIPRTCQLCLHANVSPHANWGTCVLHTYLHQKHTGPIRQLSISKFGGCNDWEEDKSKTASLDRFTEFLEKDQT